MTSDAPDPYGTPSFGSPSVPPTSEPPTYGAPGGVSFDKQTDSQPSYGQPPAQQSGQPAFGQPPYGQPAYGADGQGGYSQTPYGQPGYNQAGYNQAGYNQGGYGQQGYPAYGGGMQTSAGTNPLAIVSLVLGIFWFIPVVGTLAAIVLGFVARAQCKRTGQGGKGMATAGIILGFLWVAGFILLVVLVAAFGHATTCTSSGYQYGSTSNYSQSCN